MLEIQQMIGYCFMFLKGLSDFSSDILALNTLLSEKKEF